MKKRGAASRTVIRKLWIYGSIWMIGMENEVKKMYFSYDSLLMTILRILLDILIINFLLNLILNDAIILNGTVALQIPLSPSLGIHNTISW